MQVSALVCFGYPLRSPSGKVRDELLYQLEAPILFVQGTKDALCPLPKLRAVMRRMKAPHELHVVRGGDHSLEVGKRALAKKGQTQDHVDAGIADAVRDFLERHA